MSLREEFEKVLKEFMNATVGDVVGCAVARTDGLMVASVLPAGVDERRVAALGATVAGVAGKLCKDLDRGEPMRTLIEGSKGNLIAAPIGENILLIALTSKSPNLGLIFLEMERAAEAAKNVMGRRRR